LILLVSGCSVQLMKVDLEVDHGAASIRQRPKISKLLGTRCVVPSDAVDPTARLAGGGQHHCSHPWKVDATAMSRREMESRAGR
jgi:hypothetical protein